MNRNNTPNSAISARCASCGVSRNRGDRCEYCGALYLDAVNAKPSSDKLRSLDKKYRIKQQGSRVEITWIWRDAGVWFLVPFFLFWNSIAFSFLSVSEVLSDPLSAFPIPAVHLVIGVLGVGYTAVCLLNSTTITAKNNYLSLRHHPIPWPGNIKFTAGEVEHIFVSKGRRSSKKRSSDVPILQLVTVSGRRYELLKGKTEVEFADYESLRLHLLKALNLKPTQVFGAVQD